MNLEERVARLERANRRWRTGTAVAVLVAVAAGAQKATEAPQNLVAKHIQCESLEIDAQGLIGRQPFLLHDSTSGATSRVTAHADQFGAELRLHGHRFASEVKMRAWNAEDDAGGAAVIVSSFDPLNQAATQSLELAQNDLVIGGMLRILDAQVDVLNRLRPRSFASLTVDPTSAGAEFKGR